MKTATAFTTTKGGYTRVSKNQLIGFDGFCVAVYPIKIGIKKDFVVDSELFTKALASCDLDTNSISVNKKSVTVRKGAFKANVPFFKETTELVIDNTFRRIKKAPKDMLKVIHTIRRFAHGDSDNVWAEGVNVINGVAYTTNNVSVVRKKLKLPDCILPKKLVERMAKIDLPIVAVDMSSTHVTIFYSNDRKTFIQCPSPSENGPEFDKIFSVYRQPEKLRKQDLDAIRTVLGMAFSDDETIKIKKGTVSNSVATVTGVSVRNTCVSADELRKALLFFTNVRFGKQYSFFSNDEGYEAIIASRVS